MPFHMISFCIFTAAFFVIQLKKRIIFKRKLSAVWLCVVATGFKKIRDVDLLIYFS